MSHRVLLVVASLVFAGAELHARNPFFGSGTTMRRLAAQGQFTRPFPSRILQSSEKLTEIHGPSILIRDPVAKPKKSKFVSQP